MSHYDDMIMDIMHISKKEYDFITQRNRDLEIHSNCLIEENNSLKKNIDKLREDNVFLRSEIEELNEVIRNKNNEIGSLNNCLKDDVRNITLMSDEIKVVVDFKCGDDDE